MRIDFQYNPQPLLEANRTGSQSAPAANPLATPAGEDQAQWSGQPQVEALAAQASQLPEIREQRVESLRQAVASGSYSPDTDQVAGAMLDEMISAA